MKISNKLKLPQPFVDAVSGDYQYKEKRYSVTTLLKPIREIMLLRRHNSEIEQDVSDMIWAIFGTAVHSVLENNTNGKLIAEQKLEMKIGDYTLSGKSDLFDPIRNELIDYKVTSTFKVLKQDFEDYRLQGLMYCYLLKNNDFECNKASFWLILRDWQKSKAKFDKSYPQNQLVKVAFKFKQKDFDLIKIWLENKFNEIKESEKLTDENLPLCSSMDRWNNGDVFAVMSKNRKSAHKLFKDENEASKWMKENNIGDYIEIRKGEDRKCLEYCSCCEFCPYYINLKKENELPF